MKTRRSDISLLSAIYTSQAKDVRSPCISRTWKGSHVTTEERLGSERWRKRLPQRTQPGVGVGSKENEQKPSEVRTGRRPSGPDSPTPRDPTGPHGTPRDARRAEGSHGSDSILTFPLVRLTLALARRGFTASAIHSASATSRSVSVKLLQFTQAAQFRPPGCHVISPPPLGLGRRQLEAVQAATWDKLVRDYLYAKDSAHSGSGPAPALAPPPATPCKVAE